MKLLLKYNASINERNHKGRTAFHDAVKKNSIKALKILLQRDVFIDNRYNRGQTVSHAAALSNSIESIELLLLEGDSGILEMRQVKMLYTLLQVGAT